MATTKSIPTTLAAEAARFVAHLHLEARGGLTPAEAAESRARFAAQVPHAPEASHLHLARVAIRRALDGALQPA